MADLGNRENQAFGTGTYTMRASDLSKNDPIMLKGRPCKIVEISTSVSGKHGNAKVTIVGEDLFTGQRHEDVVPPTENVDVPNLIRKEYSLIDITSDGGVSLMDEQGDMRDDLKLPEGELGEEIKVCFEADKELLLKVTKAVGEEAILSYKIASQK
ncbi:eukaryotic translation initiation factor 5A-like [Branchiostoma lanceolatum]|uniref:eukaryotic translation initiation factor 5A-like n=1 Tax=Branchiostoma lanceolatum TaxID=7740 RepID=UPI0034566AFE